MNRKFWVSGVAALAVASLASAGCAHTAHGVKEDAKSAAETVEGAAETFDVKAALINDGRVTAANIDVDTNGETKTVYLKGTVPSAEQRGWAEQIARQEAKGYRVVNQLVVSPAG